MINSYLRLFFKIFNEHHKYGMIIFSGDIFEVLNSEKLFSILFVFVHCGSTE